MYKNLFLGVRSFLLIAIVVLGGLASVEAQKPSPQEIMAKNVASICKPADMGIAKLRMAIGASMYSLKEPPTRTSGRAVLASDGNEMALFATFSMRDYPQERVGLFSDKVEAPTLDIGQKSALGSFLTRYDKYMTDRIFGGTVFSTWMFMNPDAIKGKLENEGKKKVGDREAWVLKYTPKGGLGADSYIRIYIDAENFHHLRTVYRQGQTDQGFSNTTSMGANAGGNWGGEMASNGHTLTEDFSDIREVDGITLPHKYSIVLFTDGSAGSREFRYDFDIEKYTLVKSFPANFFSFGNAPKS